MKSLKISMLLAALTLFLFAMPVNAQMGGIVFDPTSYAGIIQNGMTQIQQYLQQIQQYMTQYQQLMNQISQYQNMVQNTTQLPQNVMSQIVGAVGQATNLFQKIQGLGSNIGNLGNAFQQMYPQTYTASNGVVFSGMQTITDTASNSANAVAQWSQQEHVAHQAVFQTGDAVNHGVISDQQAIQQLSAASQNADGALKIGQTQAQAQLLVAKQLADLKQQMQVYAEAPSSTTQRKKGDDDEARAMMQKVFGLATTNNTSSSNANTSDSNTNSTNNNNSENASITENTD